MAKKKLSRVEQLKRERDNNYVRLAVIAFLVVFIAVGGRDITDSAQPNTNDFDIPTLNNFNEFKTDLSDYLININKKNLPSLNSDVQNIVNDIEVYKDKLDKYKNQEQLLQSQLMIVPTEIYKHNKLDLIAFMVEVLKEEGLIYEVNYNYTAVVEDTTLVETQGDVETLDSQATIEQVMTKDLFSIVVSKVNSQTYPHLLNFLDKIFIKESYSIEKVLIDYDPLVKEYYIELVIGI